MARLDQTHSVPKLARITIDAPDIWILEHHAIYPPEAGAELELRVKWIYGEDTDRDGIFDIAGQEELAIFKGPQAKRVLRAIATAGTTRGLVRVLLDELHRGGHVESKATIDEE